MACAADSVLPQVVIRHHDLFVQIVPDQHLLIAKDRLTIEVPPQKGPIRFSLAPTLQVDRIVLVQESAGVESPHDVPFELERGSTPESVQEVRIPSQAVVAGLVASWFLAPGEREDARGEVHAQEPAGLQPDVHVREREEEAEAGMAQMSEKYREGGDLYVSTEA